MIVRKPLLHCLVDLANSGPRVITKSAPKYRFIGLAGSLFHTSHTFRLTLVFR